MLESFNGGFVSARPASLLAPGECALLQNAIYLPGQDNPRTMYGREQVAALASTRSVDGIADCRFDDGTHTLVVLDDTNLLYTTDAENISTLASLTQLASGGSGLLALQSDNKWYLLNSGQRPQALLQDGSTRAAGLLPVTSTPALATVAGTWNDVATGYYQYWTTEIVRSTAAAEGGSADSPFVLESTFAGTPGTVLVDSLSKGVQITLPEPVNSNTTHVRVYRAGPMSYSTDSLFPVGEANISDVVYPFDPSPRILDGATTSTSGYYATASATAADLNYFFATVNMSAASVTNIMNATGANNGAVAFISHPVGALSTRTVFGLKAFKNGSADLIDAVTDPIAGINLVCHVRGVTSTPSSLTVRLSLDGGASWSEGRVLPVLPNSFGIVPMTIGSGSRDTWGLFPTKSSFSANNLLIAFIPTAGADDTDLDSCQVVVYYNGSAGGDGTPFPAVVIEAGGLTAGGGMNGVPPTATTGAMFEGSMVINDVSKPSTIRYSQPGKVEYFPELYSIKIDSSDNDDITYIGAVNNRLVVGLKGAIYRCNYLPLQDDAQFIPQRTVELISDVHGIVGPKAACNMTDANGRTALAFVSPNGVFLTDGVGVFPISDDLKWTNGSDAVFLSSDVIYTDIVALINDPLSQTLRLLKKNGGSYFASYAARHRKQTGLKWTGPNYVLNKFGSTTYQLHSAAVIRKNSGVSQILYGYSAGASGSNIYAEDGATVTLPNTIPYAGANLLKLKTRRIYPNGIGGQARLTDVYLLGRDTGVDLGTSENSPWTLVTADVTYSNANPTSDYYLANAGGDNAELIKLPIDDISGDSFQFTLMPYGNENRFSYWSLQLNFEDQGQEATRA